MPTIIGFLSDNAGAIVPVVRGGMTIDDAVTPYFLASEGLAGRIGDMLNPSDAFLKKERIDDSHYGYKVYFSDWSAMKENYRKLRKYFPTSVARGYPDSLLLIDHGQSMYYSYNPTRMQIATEKKEGGVEISIRSQSGEKRRWTVNSESVNAQEIKRFIQEANPDIIEIPNEHTLDPIFEMIPLGRNGRFSRQEMQWIGQRGKKARRILQNWVPGREVIIIEAAAERVNGDLHLYRSTRFDDLLKAHRLESLDIIDAIESLGRIFTTSIIDMSRRLQVRPQELYVMGTAQIANSILASHRLSNDKGLPLPRPGKKIQGGYVAMYSPGLNAGAAKIDFFAMYYSIIKQFNLSPRGFDSAIFISELDRLMALRTYYKNNSSADPFDPNNITSKKFKILINTLGYGYLGSGYDHFYNDPDIAELISRSGRYLIKTTEAMLRQFGPKVRLIETDTDGIIIDPGDVSLRQIVEYVNSDLESPVRALHEHINTILGRELPYDRNHYLRVMPDGPWDMVYFYKSKNYVIFNGDEIVVKGSSLHGNGLSEEMERSIHLGFEYYWNTERGLHIDASRNLRDLKRIGDSLSRTYDRKMKAFEKMRDVFQYMPEKIRDRIVAPFMPQAELL